MVSMKGEPPKIVLIHLWNASFLTNEPRFPGEVEKIQLRQGFPALNPLQRNGSLLMHVNQRAHIPSENR